MSREETDDAAASGSHSYPMATSGPMSATNWVSRSFSARFRSNCAAGAHAPDEYWVVEAANPKVAGMDGAARSFVDLFYALA